MAYCTQTDVQNAAGGAERLRALVDWDGDTAVDAEPIAQAIADADAWINSYVARKRAVPLSPAPDIVRLTSAREAVYLLKQARGMAVTEDDKTNHEERERWLEGVAAGKISLGVDPSPAPSTANAAEYGERESSDDDAFARDSFGGFV